MANIDLSQYGITGTTEIIYNPSYKTLFEEETKEGLTGYEKGQVSELGAVDVKTGIFTGRSPKDKFIVDDETSHDTVWWDSEEYHNDNHRATKEAWAAVKDIAKKELSNKRLFVVDGFCGANTNTRMAVRFIVEVAWQAHFVRNMFIKTDPRKRKQTSSRTSSSSTLRRQKSRTTKSSACIPTRLSSSTSRSASRSSSTPGTAAR